jgi:ribosomal protein S18 acetylase RimI-like enzyme
MPRRLRIEPVSARGRHAALRFIAAGDERGPLAEAQAESLEGMLRRRPGRPHLWWARRGRRRLAAAMVLPSPGRVGMLFAAPADAAGVDREALVAVLQAAAQDALESGAPAGPPPRSAGGCCFVQGLTAPQAEADAAALEAAGFRPLAELIYMERDLSSPQQPPAGAADASSGAGEELTWRQHEASGRAAGAGAPGAGGREGTFTDAELIELIQRTYGGSLDCPALAGLRTMAEVIAGHKATGSFRPEAWWVVEAPLAAPGAAGAAGEPVPVGCILVNDAGGRAAEVAYMGVVPEARGRGVGTALLRHSARQGRARGRRKLTLAVDAGNVYALALYRREGFVETHRRRAFIMTPRGARREPRPSG